MGKGFQTGGEGREEKILLVIQRGINHVGFVRLNSRVLGSFYLFVLGAATTCRLLAVNSSVSRAVTQAYRSVVSGPSRDLVR